MNNTVSLYKNQIIGEAPFNVIITDIVDNNHFKDEHNNIYLDVTSGYGVTNIGWKNKQIIEVAKQQYDKAHFLPPWLATKEAVELSQLLLSTTTNSLHKCCKALSGTDAVETIFKAIACYTNKLNIISFKYSYHGGLHFALSISDNFNFSKYYNSNTTHLIDPPYCYRCKFGKTPTTCNLECTNRIEALIKQDCNIGTICIEPVLASGGVIIPPQIYFDKIMQLCKTYNLLFVVDEVLTGFGRLGALTATDLFKLSPDAISYGKGISSGYATISAALLNKNLADAFSLYEDTSATMAWNQLSCKIASFNINYIIQHKLSQNAASLGFTLLNQIKEVFLSFCPDHVGEVRGTGMLIGVELIKNKLNKEIHPLLAKKIVIKALHEKLLVTASWNFSTLIFMPTLAISNVEIDELIFKLKLTLKQVFKNP